MKNNVIIALLAVLLMSSCAKEFNQVYKTSDYDYKYEYAKECFAAGKYNRAVTLLQDIVTIMKGTDNAEECLYMLAMSAYCAMDYETASQYFKKYYTTYPHGVYAEMASFYVGQSLYMSTPEPRLDQSPTMSAIAAFQEYLDLFPNAQLKEQAHMRLFELQDKLVQKELHSAKLYYDLGTYMLNSLHGGSNYEACIVCSENALRDYPYAKPERREQFMLLALRSRYHLARQSVEDKRLERFRQTIDEYYGFANEFPESKYLKEAQEYLVKSQRALKGQPLDDE